MAFSSVRDMVELCKESGKPLYEVILESDLAESGLTRTEAIILSMTPREREHPQILQASRKRRIAAGSGTRVEDVNALLKQFEQMQKMMKQFTGKGKKRRGMRGLPPGFPNL